jgi:hypothetical protein
MSVCGMCGSLLDSRRDRLTREWGGRAAVGTGIVGGKHHADGPCDSGAVLRACRA